MGLLERTRQYDQHLTPTTNPIDPVQLRQLRSYNLGVNFDFNDVTNTGHRLTVCDGHVHLSQMNTSSDENNDEENDEEENDDDDDEDSWWGGNEEDNENEDLGDGYGDFDRWDFYRGNGEGRNNMSDNLFMNQMFDDLRRYDDERRRGVDEGGGGGGRDRDRAGAGVGGEETSSRATDGSTTTTRGPSTLSIRTARWGLGPSSGPNPTSDSLRRQNRVRRRIETERLAERMAAEDTEWTRIFEREAERLAGRND